MKSNFSVKIQSNRLNEKEYIVKDTDNIIIGRVSIIELNQVSKRCDVKLNFYRESKYKLLKDTLILLLKAIFKDRNIFKVNIKVFENINFDSFLDLGFTLEGIFIQNEYCNGDYNNELSFGITRDEYKQLTRVPLIELKGKEIILRNLTPGNAEDLLKYYIKNKKHLAPFEPTRDMSFYTIEHQVNLLNESYKQLLNGTNIELGIFKGENLIGKIKLSNIVYGSFRSGFLGYSIDEDEQGKGYMKESVKLFLKYIFEECEMHRIEASALVDNEKSKGVLKACGFKELGVNKKYLYINGQWQDHITYYLIKE